MQINYLGANLTGAKVGLAVPAYMDVNSIDELTDQAGKKIIGIEPGAGVVTAAENTIKKYDNLKDWKVETSSSGAMTVALGQAIKKHEPIVVTGWTPHWMFAKYDLKYLEDPENGMGSEEQIQQNKWSFQNWIKNPVLEAPYSSVSFFVYKKENAQFIFETSEDADKLPFSWVWHPMGREGLEPATR